MELFFEILFEVFGETLFNLFFELSCRSLIEPFAPNRKREPVLAAAGYMIFGLASGGLSLIVFPRHLVKDPGLRLASLFIAPILAGSAMSLLGKRRVKAGADVIGLDRLSYGFLFAFAMSIVRYFFAK